MDQIANFQATVTSELSVKAGWLGANLLLYRILDSFGGIAKHSGASRYQVMTYIFLYVDHRFHTL